MPQFLSENEFRAAEAAIDILLPDARVITARAVAERADEFLAASNSPSGPEIRQALDFLESALPLVAGKLPPFSGLSKPARRQVLEKLIDGTGLMRDLARSLKLITFFSYYTHPDARNAIGYIEFEQRPRFPSLNTTPLQFPPVCP